MQQIRNLRRIIIHLKSGSLRLHLLCLGVTPDSAKLTLLYLRLPETLSSTTVGSGNVKPTVIELQQQRFIIVTQLDQVDSG